MAIIYLDLVVLHCSLIDFYGALVLEHHFLLIIQSLLRYSPSIPRFAVALQVHFRLRQEILVPLKRALRLHQRGLIRTSVNLNQWIALANDLPLFVVHLGDNSVHLARNRSSVNWRDRADTVEIKSNIAFLRGSGRHGNRTTPHSWRTRILRAVIVLVQNQPESSSKDQEQNEPHDNADTFVLGWTDIRLLLFRPAGRMFILVNWQVDYPLS